MLVLTRKEGQSIRIDDRIKISIVAVKGGRVRVGIEAPAEVAIVRDDAKPASANASPQKAESKRASRVPEDSNIDDGSCYSIEIDADSFPEFVLS